MFLFSRLNKKITFWLTLVIVATAIIILPPIFKTSPAETNLSPIQSVNNSSSPQPKSTLQPFPDSTKSNSSLPTPVPSGLISSPASCSLTGAIRFLNPNLYQDEGAKIVYKNVDDHARFIFWKVSPDDGVLRVGPNIFAELILPNGTREIGVSISKPSLVKLYTLTASVTYGVINSKGSEEIRESQCSGTARVIMPPEN